MENKIYYAVDISGNITDCIEQNAAFSRNKFKTAFDGKKLILSENTTGFTRKTELYKWWDYEAIVCHLGGFHVVEVKPGVTLPAITQELLQAFNKLSTIPKIARLYQGEKFIEKPIVTGHLDQDAWCEELCDATRIIYTGTQLITNGKLGPYWDTLCGYGTVVNDEDVNHMAREMALATFMEFYLEGIKVYSELEEGNMDTKQILRSISIQHLTNIDYIKQIVGNIRYVPENFKPKHSKQVFLSLKRIQGVVDMESVLNGFCDIIRSPDYELVDHYISAYKCNIFCRYNPKHTNKDFMLEGNQWLNRYFDGDIEDELSKEEWASICGLREDATDRSKGCLNAFLDARHFAAYSGNIKPYSGSSYGYQGCNISAFDQQSFLDGDQPNSIDVPYVLENGKLKKREPGQWSIAVIPNTRQPVMVSRRKVSRFLRFIGQITVTIKLPIVDVSKTGEFSFGEECPDINDVLNKMIGDKNHTSQTFWILNKIFSGKIAINKRSQIQCFIPRVALSEDSIIFVREMLKPWVLRKTVVVRVQRGSQQAKYFWAPTKKGNIFSIDVRRTTIHLKETDKDYPADGVLRVVKMSVHKPVGAFGKDI